MTIATGLVVANNYYNQPLLGKIATEFAVSEAAVSKITVLTQLGYAAGLLLIIPLGDKIMRKPCKHGAVEPSREQHRNSCISMRRLWWQRHVQDSKLERLDEMRMQVLHGY